MKHHDLSKSVQTHGIAHETLYDALLTEYGMDGLAEIIKWSMSDIEPSIKSRYGQICKCGDYRSYGSTLKSGVAYAMLFPPNACVNCMEMERKVRFVVNRIIGINQNITVRKNPW